MSEQMGMLFFVLFVVAAALCVYLSLSMSRRALLWRASPARHTNGILGMRRLIATTVHPSRHVVLTGVKAMACEQADMGRRGSIRRRAGSAHDRAVRHRIG